jgi:pimeloyl-ACP methyl ester carboxylesterase
MQKQKQTEEKRITVDGVEVSYRVSGPANERRPLVLVHGTAGSLDGHFGFLFPMMAFRQRVIGINLAEPLADRAELAHFAAQVAAVINAEVPNGPVTLLGYSLGAPIAAKTAAQLGNKVENLILVAGWVKTDTHQKVRNHIWTTLQKEGSPAVKTFMTLMAFSPFHMKSRSVEEMLAGTAKLKITPFIEKQMELNARVDITADCEQIKAKTLVVAMSDDFAVPKYHSKMLFGAIENASYTEVSAGHAVVHERPAELFYHIDRFSKDPAAYPVGAIVPAQKP